MAGMGPTPKAADQRRRRNAPVANTVKLPACGRVGAAPDWPLPAEIKLMVALGMDRDDVERARDEWTAASDLKEVRGAARRLEAAKRRLRTTEMSIEMAAVSERDLWELLWTTPQAVQWERMRWDREVAQYVRWKVKAEGGDLDASKEARQLADRLGLTPLSMLRLRWEISVVDPDGSEESAEGSVAPAAQRRRLKVV